MQRFLTLRRDRSAGTLCELGVLAAVAQLLAQPRHLPGLLLALVLQLHSQYRQLRLLRERELVVAAILRLACSGDLLLTLLLLRDQLLVALVLVLLNAHHDQVHHVRRLRRGFHLFVTAGAGAGTVSRSMQRRLELVEQLVDHLLALQRLSQEHVLRFLLEAERLAVSFLPIYAIESYLPIQLRAQGTQLSSLRMGIHFRVLLVRSKSLHSLLLEKLLRDQVEFYLLVCSKRQILVDLIDKEFIQYPPLDGQLQDFQILPRGKVHLFRL